MKRPVPHEARVALGAALAVRPEVYRAMLVHHAEGDEPTAFSSGVLRVELRDDSTEDEVEAVRRLCVQVLGRLEPLVPVACGTVSDIAASPLANRGGSVLIAARSS